MNIYRCVSEEMTAYITGWNIPEGCGVPESYRIAELVAADSRSKAKWLAWKTDPDSFTGNIIDMPRMSVVCTRKCIDLPEGVIERRRPAWWDSPAEIRKLWRDRHVLPDGWLSPESKLAYQAL